MKIFVKTLKGTTFDIEADPTDTVADVKRNIERAQGTNIYPACQQMLIHQGKVLKDDTTLQENTVVENSFVVVMLTKNKASSSETSKTSVAPPTKVTHTSDPTPAVTAPPPQTPIVAAAPQRPTVAPPAAVTTTPAPTPLPSVPASTVTSADAYGEAASHLVAGTDLEGAVQQILDMGGGTWDRAIVIRALRAAFNNPERAVEYLYSGIPEQTEVPSEARQASPAPQALPPNPPPQAAAQPPPEAAAPTNQPNSNPLDLFPQGLPTMGTNAATGGAGTLDFLRSSHQFRALQAMVQSNPQILQPMLQELGRQNPQLMRLIQEHQSDFLQLINEPSSESRGNNMEQVAAINVTREEHEAIERLEQMGFERSTVVEVFFACNKDEEVAANYLLDHIHEFEE